MGEILTVVHRGGGSFPLQSKGNTITGIKAAGLSMELNGNDTVTLTVESTAVLPFALGDTITVGGSVYTLNLLPQIDKLGEHLYSYKATFEGLHYLLLNTAWLMPFSALNDALAGDLATYATQLVANLNRAQPNMWEVGTIATDTETKVLSFSDTNCLDVLQQICEEWGVEFAIAKTEAGKYQLSIVNEVGSQINYIFKYGATGGLYDLQRNGIDDSDFGTRIYFYGGSNNIPNDYFNERQSTRLCLAKQIVGQSQTNNPQRNESYIEQPDAVALYGRIERTKVFEDIYPNRIGSVTAIDANNRLKFKDNTMFNLNATDSDGNTLYLISGTTAKIHFNTGALAGYDFDISSYDHSTKTFTINEIQDENNYKFPSEDNTAFRVAVGDEYIITDIILPDSYVTAAQNELQTAAQDWYEKHCAPAVEYVLTMDEMFLSWLARQLNIDDDTPIFHIGDKITVADSQLWTGNKQFRITTLERDLTKQYGYTLGIAVTDERRRQYVWKRRRNRHILPAVLRAGLFDVAFSATQANNEFKQTLNTGRLADLFDDGTRKLRGGAIADSTIIARMINNGAVVSDKIANDAIVAAKIAAGAILATKIADGAVGTSKLADLAVVAGKIAASAVTAAKIADNAVTTGKIANNAITATKIATGAVTKQKLDIAATMIAERCTMQVSFDANEKAISVSAGIYTNDLLGERQLLEDVKLAKPIDGEEFLDNVAYNVYFDTKEDAVVASAGTCASEEGYILLGMIGATRNGEKTFTPRILNAEPISASRIGGGILRFTDANGNVKEVKATDTTANNALSKSTSVEQIVGVDANSGLRYSVGDLIDKVGEDITDTGGLLYLANQLDTYARVTLKNKINEMVDSTYSANQILLAIQNNFNTMRSQLISRNLINQSGDSGTVNALGIERCTWNPLQQHEQCSADPQGIGIPDRLQ